ncbi:C39 family peptidase, partial [Micromonospora tulbaghiae]
MATTLLRKTVLTTAGIAATAGGIAGPAIAAHAAPTEKTTAVVADRKGHGERELDVRYEAQPNFYFCGPAAARNALSVQGKNIDVHAMAKEMGTTEAGTNSINDITPVLNKETGASNAYKSV